MAKKSEGKPTLSASGFDRAEASPGFLFWKAFNSWSRQLRLELDSVGLTQVQYSILAAIAYLGSTAELVTQQDVANQLAMDKMMVSDVVKTLERKELLERAAHPRDGRSMTLSLTSAGKRLLKKAVPIVEAADDEFFGRLRGDQLGTFKKYLLQLTDGDP